MKITIRFEEISNFIEKKLKVKLNFVCIDSTSFEINYKPGFLPSIGINFKVEDIEDNVLRLSYDCNKAASLVIAGAVAYIENSIPKALEVDTTNKNVVVRLQNFDKLEKVLNVLYLENIYFDSETINVISKLK